MAVYLGSNQVDLLGGDGIPSAYLIPSGTYSISQNGVYDIGSYKSVDVDLEYYGIYQQIMKEGHIYASGNANYGYTSSDVINWCNSYSRINANRVFQGVNFQGSFYFNNITSYIQDHAFAFGYCNYGTALSSGADLYFSNFSSTLTSGVFYQNTNIKSINMPLCNSIGNHAFASCTKLTTVDIPNCTSIGAMAFYLCSKLTSAIFPSCSYISISAFFNCTSLTSISFPNCSYIASSVFYCCYSLTSAIFPNCSHIDGNAFYNCSSLTSTDFLNCSYVGDYAFGYCRSLTLISFPNCSYIASNTFRACYNLLSLYLLGSLVPSLASTNAFASNPISNYTTSTGGVYGSIYVPSSLYNQYVTATNWMVFSSRFVSV